MSEPRSHREETLSSVGRSGDVLLEIQDLTVSYSGGSIKALHKVNLQVHQGDIVALLGVNGAGKTTLLRAVTGLLPMHGGTVVSGQVRYRGENLAGVPAWKRTSRGISISLEGRRVFPKLSVEDNLRAGGYTAPRARRRELISEILQLFPRLDEKREVAAGLLSGGEQQMLAVGRALMQTPDLLLLDEPSLGLAPKIVQQIRDIIQEINQSGCSVLLIEQNVATALSIADYAYVLDGHQIQREGTGEDVRNDPTLMEIYLGTSAKEVTAHG